MYIVANSSLSEIPEAPVRNAPGRTSALVVILDADNRLGAAALVYRSIEYGEQPSRMILKKQNDTRERVTATRGAGRS
jgi:hypothetical protein